MVRLTEAERDRLLDLHFAGTAAHNETCGRLEALGLIVTGRSRFGAWAKLSEAGREHVAKVLPPGSHDGASQQAGYSYRGATPRNHGDVAPQARRSAAIAPPAAVLDVGEHLSPGAPADQDGSARNTERKPEPLTMKQIVDRITEMVVENAKRHRRTSHRAAEQ